MVGSDIATANERESYEAGKVNKLSQIDNMHKRLEDNQMDESIN